jgi:DNA-binding NarL/FixJ family response regulator
MRVLIADSARTRRGLLRESLVKLGVPTSKIEEAGLGDQAVGLVSRKTAPIDVVLADWDLPGAEGKLLLERLAPLQRAVPAVVVYMAYEQRRAEVKETLRLGARDFLIRPFTDEDLRARLRNLEEKQTIRRTRAASDMLKSIASTVEPAVDLPFLVTLPSAIMKDLLKAADKHVWEAGTEIVRPGGAVALLYVITVGEVELLDPSGQAVEVCQTGDPFLEAPFLTEKTSPFLARAKTWTQGISISRPKLAELLQRQPHLSMHLSALLARKTKAAPAPVGKTEFQGNLSSMGFSDVLQLLQFGRKTGTLTLRRDDAEGGIEVAEGEASHAWTPAAGGEAAFYELAAWENATFSFTSGDLKHAKTIGTPTMSLLMEAMRLRDEKSRGSEGGGLDQLFGGA